MHLEKHVVSVWDDSYGAMNSFCEHVIYVPVSRITWTAAWLSASQASVCPHWQIQSAVCYIIRCNRFSKKGDKLDTNITNSWHGRVLPVFQFVILKHVDPHIQNYNIAVVSYGCETWSVTLGVEQMARVFKNTVLRKTFGPKRDTKTGEWRRLHEEIHDLYSITKYYVGD